MKKKSLKVVSRILILLVMLLSFTTSFAANEFDPRRDGHGYSVLIIDDFNDYWEGNHGHNMTSIFYKNLPMLEIVQLDFTEASDFKIDDPYDLVVCFFYPSNEEKAKQYLSADILAVKSITLCPAGNDTNTWYIDNPLDKWFITVGAKGQPDWREGEVTWEEDPVFGGSCGACAMFGIQILNKMIESDLNAEGEGNAE